MNVKCSQTLLLACIMGVISAVGEPLKAPGEDFDELRQQRGMLKSAPVPDNYQKTGMKAPLIPGLGVADTHPSS